MISGAIGAAYGMFVLVRYTRHGGGVAPLFGDVPMAFTTAVIAVVYGLAIFWDGWLTRERAIQRPPSRRWTSHQVLQLLLAIISALTVIATTLIGIWKVN